MLLQPNKTKFKKIKKSRLKQFDFKANEIINGNYALKAKNSGHISAKSLESARQVLNKHAKRQGGKVWTKIFPFFPITAKPVETRMGKGKGSVHHWSAKVSCGTVIFEVIGMNFVSVLNVFKIVSTKLPVKTKVFIK